jgi:hypothetical protein
MLITLRVLAKNEAPKVQRVLRRDPPGEQGREGATGLSAPPQRKVDLTQKGSTEQNGAISNSDKQTNKHAVRIHCHPQLSPSEFLERLCKSNRDCCFFFS